MSEQENKKRKKSSKPSAKWALFKQIRKGPSKNDLIEAQHGQQRLQNVEQGLRTYGPPTQIIENLFLCSAYNIANNDYKQSCYDQWEQHCLQQHKIDGPAEKQENISRGEYGIKMGKDNQDAQTSSDRDVENLNNVLVINCAEECTRLNEAGKYHFIHIEDMLPPEEDQHSVFVEAFRIIGDAVAHFHRQTIA